MGINLKIALIICGFVTLASSVAAAFGPVSTPQTMGVPQSSGRAEVVQAVGDDGPRPVQSIVGDAAYGKFIQKVQLDTEKEKHEAPPEPEVNFNINDLIARYGVVVIVNKAGGSDMGPNGQHMAVYHDCKPVDGGSPDCKIDIYPVSTGQEAWVCDPIYDKTTKQKVGGWQQVWTGTPTGCYTVLGCDIDHRSNEFGEAPMPKSCFFNGGKAIHQGVEPEKFGKARASHACVRTTAEASKNIFDLMMATQSNFDPRSKMYRAQCNPWENVSPVDCQNRPESIAANKVFEQEVATVVNSLKDKEDYDGKPLPYNTDPPVANVNPDGSFAPGTHAGIRSVVCVICKDKDGNSCAKTGTNAHNQQPKPKPAASLQAKCQEDKIREINQRAQKEKWSAEKLAAMLPSPLQGQYAAEANAYCQSNACITGVSQAAPTQQQPFNLFQPFNRDSY